MLPAATASDGGGSTRIPAAFSGLVGFKPSHGRIPHPGAPGSETSVYGLLTTTVADSARHLDVVAGPDDRDRFSLPASGQAYESAIDSLPVEGLRARWSADLGFARCDPEVRALAEAAARQLAEAAGLVLDEEPVELTDPVRTWLGAGSMDLWLELEPGAWPGVKDDLTRYSRSVLEQTEAYPVPKLAQAAIRREQLTLDAARLFGEVDVVITPTTAVPAFPAEGPPPEVIDGEQDRARSARRRRRSRCWRTCAGTRRSRSRPGSPTTACRSGCRSSPVDMPTRCPCGSDASGSSSAPGPDTRRPERRRERGRCDAPQHRTGPVDRRSLGLGQGDPVEVVLGVGLERVGELATRHR